MHNPLSHRIVSPNVTNGPPPTEGEARAVYEFLCNAQIWFNRETARFLSEFKKTQDVFGGNLLDHTVVPFVTDVAEPCSSRAPLPAMVLGGRAFGLQGGRFLDFEQRPLNDFWLGVLQAFFPGKDVHAALAHETFAKNTAAITGPISGLFEA